MIRNKIRVQGNPKTKTSANGDWDYEREPLLGSEETICHFRSWLSICTDHLPDDWKVIPGIIRGFGVDYRVKFSGLFDHVYGWWKV